MIAPRLGWRWAFLIQLPMFVVSFLLTSVYLRYVTPVRLPPYVTCDARTHFESQGSSKSTKQVLKRIDYGGTFTLLGMVCPPNHDALKSTLTLTPGPLLPHLP